MIKSIFNTVRAVKEKMPQIPSKKPFRLTIATFFYAMLLFVPISIFCGIFTDNTVLIFITSILAIIPLAQIIGYATKEIAIQANPKIAGLVSATFGNAIELIIAIFALRQGLVQVVQASIIGSILGNILMIVGVSVFFGGLKHKYQKFNKEAVGVSSTMLIIAVVGLTIPTLFSHTINVAPRTVALLGDAVAIIFAIIYIAGLFFSLRTHRDLFDASDNIREMHTVPTLSKRNALLLILASTVVVAIISNFLVKTFEHAALSLGLTQAFIGIVVLSFISNIAEYSIAIKFAKEDKLDVSFQIGLSSATQIALFVVPILLILSNIFGWGFSLVFTLFEILSVIMAVLIINHLAADGRCNWLEGAQLISVYLIIAIAFFFVG